MTEIPDELTELEPVFRSFPDIGLVYLFGSRARGQAGPMSDYDFGVYLDERDPAKRFRLRLKLMGILSRILKTDRVDVVILNDVRSPELKYSVIKDGILIFEVEPWKVLVEPRILNEYFDFHQSLVKHNLTRAR